MTLIRSGCSLSLLVLTTRCGGDSRIWGSLGQCYRRMKTVSNEVCQAVVATVTHVEPVARQHGAQDIARTLTPFLHELVPRKHRHLLDGGGRANKAHKALISREILDCWVILLIHEKHLDAEPLCGIDPLPQVDREPCFIASMNGVVRADLPNDEVRLVRFEGCLKAPNSFSNPLPAPSGILDSDRALPYLGKVRLELSRVRECR